jgi:formaldehyde-activating enzyme involved in methanogenesis
MNNAARAAFFFGSVQEMVARAVAENVCELLASRAVNRPALGAFLNKRTKF